MSAKEMWDYLPGTASVDSDTTLALVSQKVAKERGFFPGQKRMRTDGGGYITTTRNTMPQYEIDLQFNAYSESDAGILVDMFYNATIGKGMERSFNWTHPTDGHKYIAKFNTPDLSRSIEEASIHGLGRVKLIVLDRSTV